MTSETGSLIDIEFSSELKMSHANEGVGSGKLKRICLCPEFEVLSLL